MRRAALAWLLSVASVAYACGTDNAPLRPRTLERAERVTFVCFDVPLDEEGRRLSTGGRPVPLEECGPCVARDREGRAKIDEDTGRAKIIPLERCRERAACGEPLGAVPADRALHALLTQTTRGEVAAIDLGDGQVLDSSQAIPGFTFLPVGDLPVAIAAPDGAPDFTYVANFGSADISQIPTEEFRSSSRGCPLPTMDGGVPRSGADAGADAALPLLGDEGIEVGSCPTVPLPGRPVDMVLAPDEQALLLAIPELSAVVRVPVGRAGAGRAEAPVTLTAQDGEPVAAPAAAPYRHTCNRELPPPASAPPRSLDVGAGAEARPAALAVDSARGLLLVADSALPMIHVLDAETLAPQAPLFTGTPTLDVAVTPPVPADASDMSLAVQYVYAIDATDRSVLVLDAGTGELQPANAGFSGRPDRVALGDAGATSLEVLAPLGADTNGIPRDAEANCGLQPRVGMREVPDCDDDGETRDDAQDEMVPGRRVFDADAQQLRGVFVAVATTDSQIRIVDVHDLDAECRVQHCERCQLPVCPPASDGEDEGEAMAMDMDMDMPDCRPADTTCRPGRDDMVAIQRHQPRVLEFPIQAPAVPRVGLRGLSFEFDERGVSRDTVRTGERRRTPDLAPLADEVTCEQAAGMVDAGASAPDAAIADAGVGDAAVADPSGPLSPAEGCPCGLGRGFPEDTRLPPLICVEDSPWGIVDQPANDLDETWRVDFEGRIPRTRGSRGRFAEDADGVSLQGEIDFCAAGVLGRQQLRAEGGFGDLLVVRPRPRDAENLARVAPQRAQCDEDIDFADCEALYDGRMAFRIVDAYADRVTIEERMLARPDLPRDQRSFRFVRCCAGGFPLDYQVHTGAERPGAQARAREPKDPAGAIVAPETGVGAYTVIGSRTGFLHRVIEGDDGRCIHDPELPPVLTGRAYEGQPFNNDHIAFQLARDPDAPPHDLSLGLDVGIRSIESLLFSIDRDPRGGRFGDTIVVETRFNPLNEQLYLVDQARRGLIPLSLLQFPATVSSTATFE